MFFAFIQERGPVEAANVDVKFRIEGFDVFLEDKSRRNKFAAAHNRLKQKELEEKILKLANYDAPNIPVAHPTAIYALRSEVQVFYDNPISLGLDYYYIRKR